MLEAVDDDFERLVIFVRALLHAHDDVAIHLDEAAVAVPGEALVLRGGDQREHGLVVQAEVENRVHHAGHRVARAGADGDEQRHRRLVAELRAHDLLDEGNAGLDLALKLLRIGPLVLVVVGADFGGDGEARRHRQADAAHLRQVRAFAAEQRLHAAVAVGFLVSKQVNVFRCFLKCFACFCHSLVIVRSSAVSSIGSVHSNFLTPSLSLGQRFRRGLQGVFQYPVNQLDHFGQNAVAVAMITIAADHRLQARRQKTFIV